MKIYLAGMGHYIEQDKKFVALSRKVQTRILQSFASFQEWHPLFRNYIKRFEWIKEGKQS